MPGGSLHECNYDWMDQSSILWWQLYISAGPLSISSLRGRFNVYIELSHNILLLFSTKILFCLNVHFKTLMLFYGNMTHGVSIGGAFKRHKAELFSYNSLKCMIAYKLAKSMSVTQFKQHFKH